MTAKQFMALVDATGGFHDHPRPRISTHELKPDVQIVEYWDGQFWVRSTQRWDGSKYVEVSRCRVS